MTETGGRRWARGLVAAWVLAGALGVAACKDDVEKAADHVQAAGTFRAEGNVDKALVEYKNALKLNPRDPEISWAIGQVEMERGDVQTAFSYYLRAADPSLGHMAAQLEVIRILVAAGQIDDALTRANVALGLNPSHADALALRAAILQVRGQDAEAVRDAQEVLRQDPAHTGAAVVLATDALRQKDFSRAEAQLRAVLDPAAPDPALLRLLGLALAAQDKTAEATAAFRALVEREPLVVENRAILARLLLQGGDRDAALAVLVEGTRQDGPQAEAASLALVEFLAEADGLEAAAAKLRDLIAATPHSGTFDRALAALHARAGDTRRATEVLQAAAARLGESEAGLEVLASLGQYFAAIGDGAKARETVESVLAVQPAHPGALAVRAALYSSGGRTEDALRDVNTILGSDPRNALALGMLADLMGRGNRLPEAAEALERLLEVQPQNEAARLQLAAVLEASGQRQRADDMLAEQVRRSPASIAAWTVAARMAMARQDWDAAQRALSRLATVPGATRQQRHLEAEFAAARSAFDDAAERFRRLVDDSLTTALDRDALAGFTRASLLAGQGDAAAAYLETLAGQREGAEAYLAYTLLARVHEQRAAPVQMAAALRQAIAAFATDSGAYVALARMEAAQGDTAAALATLDGGLRAGADAGELLVARGMVEEIRGDAAAAMASYGEALTVNPTSLLAANNLGSLVADHFPEDQGRLQDALQRVDSFAGTDDPSLLDTVAWLNYRLGNAEAARVLLERARAATHDNPQLRYHYGAALLAVNEVEQGRAVLAALAGQTFPGSEDAARLLAAAK